jgi:hypothetical protein
MLLGRLFDLLHNTPEVVGFWCLKWWELLERLKVLQPQLLTDQFL